MKIHVIFDEDGDKVGDIESMDYTMSKLKEVKNTTQELYVNVANGLVIHCFRVLVKNGEINASDIFLYNKKPTMN